MKRTLFLLITLIPLLLSAEWLRYETDSLVLYFPENLDRRQIFFLIDESKRSTELLRKLYGWKADKKIVAVFDRKTDMANGYSRSYLKRRMHFYLYPPEHLSSLSNFKSYEGNLIVHEFSHALQVGNAGGIPKFINSIFGDYLFPGTLLPRWLKEGFAVYSESELDGTGRKNSVLYRNYLQSFFDSNRVLSLGALSGDPDHWLSGSALYLYGTFFYDYVVSLHGTEKAAKFFEEISDNVVPFLVEMEARGSFGEEFSLMYDKFLLERRIGRVAPKGRFTELFVSPPSSEATFFYASRAGERGIYRTDEKGESLILRTPSLHSFSAGKKGILLSLGVIRRHDEVKNDIFFYSEGNYRRLTRGESATYPVFSGNDSFLYTGYKRGICSVTVRSLSDAKLLFYREFPGLDTMEVPSISPDGKNLVFIGNYKKSEKNLMLYNFETGKIKEFKIEGQQYTPSFFDNGRILFSSDMKEKIVPMILDLEKNELLTVDRPEKVMLFPRLVEKKLQYVGFDNDGYYPAEKKIAWEAFHLKPLTTLGSGDDSFKNDYELEEADFYEGLLPSLIEPYLKLGNGGTSVGFTLHGEGNTLDREYRAEYREKVTGSPMRSISLLYRDREIVPGFSIGSVFSDGEVVYSDSSDRNLVYDRKSILSWIGWERRKNRFFSDYESFSRGEEQLSLSLGVRQSWDYAKHFHSDPLFPDPSPSETPDLIANFAYRWYLSFAPGSYLIFSEMERSSIDLPFSFLRGVVEARDRIIFSPTLRYSLLFGESGKLGFITSHKLHSFLKGSGKFSLGGEENGGDRIDLNRMVYGTENGITVRGYSPGAASGPTVYYSNNELRAHLFTINGGFGLLPIMFKSLQGAFFVDYGLGAKGDDITEWNYLISFGGEVKLLMYWWYHLPWLMKAGVARGLGDRARTTFYLGIGNSF